MAAADNALRMDFGSRADLGLEEIDEQEWNNNGFVRNARERRRQNDRQAAWDSSVVRHAPAHLRGQKVLRRAEPWSSFHNDDIEELNSIDDTSINEIYEITADRFVHPKHPTIVQPAWDSSLKLGRRRQQVGGDPRNRARAQTFRNARKPMNPGVYSGVTNRKPQAGASSKQAATSAAATHPSG